MFKKNESQRKQPMSKKAFNSRLLLFILWELLTVPGQWSVPGCSITIAYWQGAQQILIGWTICISSGLISLRGYGMASPNPESFWSFSRVTALRDSLRDNSWKRGKCDAASNRLSLSVLKESLTFLIEYSVQCCFYAKLSLASCCLV